MKRVLALVALACACSRDNDAQAAIDELAALDESVVSTIKMSPTESGVAEAEALVRAKSTGLRGRWLELNGARLSAAASTAMANACAKNRLSAQLARDHLRNAILNTNGELRKRGDELASALREICLTPSFPTLCSTFRGTAK